MTAREVARRVLDRVDGGSYTTLALGGELRRAALSDADRGFATELVYGTLKRRRRIDRALAAGASRGIDGLDGATRNALRLAAHQILFLRVPAHAAVDDAVGWVKRRRGARLAGFANALLRRLSREGEPPLPDPAVDPAALGVVTSSPDWLVERARAALGDEAAALLHACDAPAPVWLRINRLRTTRDAVVSALRQERPEARLEPSSWLEEALALRHGGDPSTSQLFARGLVTVQDLGAQLVARLVDPRPGERLLDACAGVGGKATHLAALSDDRATIDAADRSTRKLELCADGAHRLGVRSVRTVEVDLEAPGEAIAPAYDRLLLDAPCSGLGVIRRHPEAKWRSPPDVASLAALQARLLDALAPRVRPGGRLVYSVCTFTDEEGPAQLRAFLARHADFAVEPPPPPLDRLAVADGALRSWPQRDDADAFYAVRLRRR